MAGIAGGKALDWVILVLSIGLSAAMGWAYLSAGPGPASVRIQTQDGEYSYPLDQERRLELAGPLGTSVLRISGSQVWFESSSCHNKTCVEMGKISKPNAWIACLPNRIMVRIQINNSDGTDDFSY